jgi:hypothetical protein
MRGLVGVRVWMWRVGVGAGSQMSLSGVLRGIPVTVDPAGIPGQLTFDALVGVLVDVALHWVQALLVAPVGLAVVVVIGMPLTQVMEPLAVRMGALIVVLVVVVVIVKM